MGGQNKLALYEEIMLLALKDKEGTTHFGAYYRQALAGAILAELLLLDKIQMQPEKKKNFSLAVTKKPTGDPLLDECLERIANSKKRQQLRTWVSRFANLKKLKQRVALQLCQIGILREREGKVLLIFKRQVFPELNRKPEQATIEKLKKAVFTESMNLDPRTALLVAISHHAGLLKNVFDKKKLKSRKKRIKTIANGDAISSATKEAIEAAQVAAAMAAIMPAVLVSSTASAAS